MNGNKEIDGTEEFLIKLGISQSKKNQLVISEKRDGEEGGELKCAESITLEVVASASIYSTNLPPRRNFGPIGHRPWIQRRKRRHRRRCHHLHRRHRRRR